MMQMTVEKLFNELKELVEAGQGKKKVVVATDEEGNSYRGIYYSCESNPIKIKEAIEYSNGLIESQTEDCNDIVIIG